MKLKNVLFGIVILVLLFGLIQLIPYGKAHVNPQTVQEPKWDSPETRTLAQRACFDCHSSNTVWPWYSNVAPVSWLIQHDVDEGRGVINFSDWNATLSSGRIRNRSASEISNVILRNSMPPFYYIYLHPDAGLSTIEKDQLIKGLTTTLGTQ